jgi:hypothetical protein
MRMGLATTAKSLLILLMILPTATRGFTAAFRFARIQRQQQQRLLQVQRDPPPFVCFNGCKRGRHRRTLAQQQQQQRHALLQSFSSTTTTTTADAPSASVVALKHVEFAAATAGGGAQGEGERPPVIFLHGLLGNKRNFASISASLAQQLEWRRRIYGLDLRNHGAFACLHWMYLKDRYTCGYTYGVHTYFLFRCCR